MLLPSLDTGRLRVISCVKAHLLDRSGQTATSSDPQRSLSVDEKGLQYVGQYHDPPRRPSTTRIAVTKAALILFAILPGTVLWEFATARDPLLAKYTVNSALTTRLSQSQMASLVGLFTDSTTPAELTEAQLLNGHALDYLADPRPLVLYAAVLCMTFLLKLYAETSKAGKAQRYLVWLGVTLSPICGFLLGLGVIASALVVLPLNIILALIAADMFAWVSRD